MIINVYDPTEVDIFRRGIKGMNVGITSGCFDLFHNLHLVYLNRCHWLCDLLIVGVDSDDLVRSTKGEGRPIIPEHHRAAMVASQKSVAAAFVIGGAAAFADAVVALGVSVVFKNQVFRDKAVAAGVPAKLVIVADVIQPNSTPAEAAQKIANGTSEV